MKRGKWLLAAVFCIFLIVMCSVCFAAVHNSDNVRVMMNGRPYSFQSMVDGDPTWDPSYNNEYHDALYVKTRYEGQWYSLQSIMDGSLTLWHDPTNQVFHNANEINVNVGAQTMTIQQYIDGIDTYLEGLDTTGGTTGDESTGGDTTDATDDTGGDEGASTGEIAGFSLSGLALAVGAVAVFVGNATFGAIAVVAGLVGTALTAIFG